MKAYSYDMDGFFVGEVECQASPLEDGVFLIPGGAVEKAPPAPGEDQEVKWNGEDWAVVKSRAKTEAEAEAKRVEDEKANAPVIDPQVQSGMNAQFVGSEILAYINTLIDSKKLDPLALIADESFSKFERLLWLGQVKPAASLVKSLPSKFFTDDEKNQIATKMQS